MTAQVWVLPPRPSDDVEHPAVGVVLVLQTSSHHLVGVSRDHGEDLGQRRHCDVFQCILWTKVSTRRALGETTDESHRRLKEARNCGVQLQPAERWVVLEVTAGV